MKKRAFSLLEIIICMAILALIASTLSIGAVRLISYHKYQGDVQEIYSLMQELQKMAEVYNKSFSLDFKNQSKGLEVKVHDDENICLPLTSLHKVYKGIEKTYSSFEKKKLFNETVFFFPNKKILPETKLFFFHSRIENLQGIKIYRNELSLFTFHQEEP